MSDSKDTIAKLREKYHEKKKELLTKEAEKKIEAELHQTVYDVFQDPSKKGRAFIIAKIQYNSETKDAKVIETREFTDKNAGLAFVMNKENLNYLFNKCKKGK